MKNITILNGPNLNLLGKREPEIYGTETLANVEDACRAKLTESNAEFTLNFIQSNHEGVLIDAIHEARDNSTAIIINPGAFGHYSIALYDALVAFDGLKIEVHISNVWKREEFRHFSTISPTATGVISGLGTYGYILALDYLLKKLQNGKQ